MLSHCVQQLREKSWHIATAQSTAETAQRERERERQRFRYQS